MTEGEPIGEHFWTLSSQWTSAIWLLRMVWCYCFHPEL